MYKTNEEAEGWVIYDQEGEVISIHDTEEEAQEIVADLEGLTEVANNA